MPLDKQSQKLQDVIDKQEEFRTYRHDWAIHRIRSNLPAIQNQLLELEPLFDGIDKNPRGVSIEFKIETYSHEIRILANETKMTVEQSVDILNPADVEEILQLCESVKHVGQSKHYRDVIKKLIPSYRAQMTQILERLPNPPI